MSTTCFRDLEKKNTIGVGTRSSLGDWYDSVRAKPIEDFSIDDLCRSCRQELHLKTVVPVALSALHKDVEAGYQYDGELASVLSRIPQSFWVEHGEHAEVLVRLLRLGLDRFDDDVRKEAEAFLSRNE